MHSNMLNISTEINVLNARCIFANAAGDDGEVHYLGQNPGLPPPTVRKSFKMIFEKTFKFWLAYSDDYVK